MYGSGFLNPMTRAEAEELIAKTIDPVTKRPLPFKPLAQNKLQEWSWWCPLLSADGRCSDHANRPLTCRQFETASQELCVHFRGAESGDPTFGGETM